MGDLAKREELIPWEKQTLHCTKTDTNVEPNVQQLEANNKQLNRLLQFWSKSDKYFDIALLILQAN